MENIKKDLQTLGNTTKEPMQTIEEFLEGYKQYKIEKMKLLASVKEQLNENALA